MWWSERVARGWYGVTALAVFAGLSVQAWVTAHERGGMYRTAAGRLGNMLCYFTIQSNIVVGVVSVLLALRYRREARAFRVFQLVGLICILITGLVYHLVLAAQVRPHGLGAVANFFVHTAAPLLYVVGWLVYGPRGGASARTLAWSALPPVCWLVFTLVRGHLIDWYPYSFLDVAEIGYARTALDCVLVFLLFLLLAAVATRLDRLLPDPRTRVVGVGAGG